MAKLSSRAISSFQLIAPYWSKAWVGAGAAATSQVFAINDDAINPITRVLIATYSRMAWQAKQYLSLVLAFRNVFSARSSISRSEKFGGTTPVRSRWQFQQTSNLLSTSSWQLRQVQKVFDMQPPGENRNYCPRYSSSSRSLPSGFLMPNFSRRYCRVRKVRPRSLAALVML